MPVILDDSENVLTYADGIKSLRERLKLSTQDLANACSVSRRTVEGWEQGRPPDAGPLNLMALLLGRKKRK
jgi:DNA-binding transcriptional regulator YiaG